MGIPDYRLPRNILGFEVEQIQNMGVAIKYNIVVGKDIKLSEIERENDAIFIGIGAQTGTAMGIEGEDKGYRGFIPGIEYLQKINMGVDPYPEGGKGGRGRWWKCGHRLCALFLPYWEMYVNLVYRRTKREMPADHVEIKDAEEENVKFHLLDQS